MTKNTMAVFVYTHKLNFTTCLELSFYQTTGQSLALRHQTVQDKKGHNLMRDCNRIGKPAARSAICDHFRWFIRPFRNPHQSSPPWRSLHDVQLFLLSTSLVSTSLTWHDLCPYMWNGWSFNGKEFLSYPWQLQRNIWGLGDENAGGLYGASISKINMMTRRTKGPWEWCKSDLASNIKNKHATSSIWIHLRNVNQHCPPPDIHVSIS